MFGIIGGVGPLATTEFYSALIGMVTAKTKDRLPRLLIYSLGTSSELKDAFTADQTMADSPARIKVRNMLNSAVAFFVQNHTEMLVMPCNTLQDELASICKTRQIPYINMIDETVNEIVSAKLKRILVLGTARTCSDDLYHQRLVQHQIDCVYPTEVDQQFIDNYIYHTLFHSWDHRRSAELKGAFIQLVRARAATCDGVLIACTDLTNYQSEELRDLPIFDSLQVLAKVSAEYIVAHETFFS